MSMTASRKGLWVTNAFRLLVCLGPNTQGESNEQDRNVKSQTPFGFWYVLDGNAMSTFLPFKKVGHKRLSAFGMSWTLLKSGRYRAFNLTGHKRLSAFGMSWTRTPSSSQLATGNACHKRLSAFGMSWTRFELGANLMRNGKVTNAFRLLVCLGLIQMEGGIIQQILTVTNAFRLLVCLGPRNRSRYSTTP